MALHVALDGQGHSSSSASGLRRPSWAIAGEDPALSSRSDGVLEGEVVRKVMADILRGADALIATGLLPPLKEGPLSSMVQNLLSNLRLSELARVGQTSRFWAPRGARRRRNFPLPGTPATPTPQRSEEQAVFDQMGSLRAPGWLSGRRSRGSLASPYTPRTEQAKKEDPVAVSPSLPKALTFDSMPCKEPSSIQKDDYQKSAFDESKSLLDHLERYVRAVSESPFKSPLKEQYQKLGVDDSDSFPSERALYERPVCELVRLMTDRKFNFGSDAEAQLDGLCSELCSRLRDPIARANGWKNMQTADVDAIAEMLSSVVRSRLSPGVTAEGIVPLLELLEAFCCIGGVAKLLEKDTLLVLLRVLLLRLHEQSWLQDVPERSALLRKFNVATVELLHAVGAEASVDVLIDLWLQDEDLSQSSILPKCLQKVAASLQKRKQNPRRHVEAVFAVVHKYAPRLQNKPALIDALREFAATAQRASPEGASAWLDRRTCGQKGCVLSPVESAIFRDMLVQQERGVKQDCEKENRRSDGYQNNVTEELLCVVCLNSKRSVVFRPCNHLAVCSACSDASATQACPLCRTLVTERLMIYL